MDETRQKSFADIADRKAAMPIWMQIKRALERRILAGEFGPGMRLPTETDLASDFRVNRHTVRRALQDLGRRGLLRSEQGRGTFVGERPIVHKLTREARISGSARSSGRSLKRETVSCEAVKAKAMVARMLGLRVGAPILRVETLRTLDGAPIGRSWNDFPLPRFSGIDSEIAAHSSVAKALEAFSIVVFHHRETAITASAATVRDASVLGVPRGAPMLMLSTVNCDGGGQPLYFSWGRYVPGWINLVVDFERESFSAGYRSGLTSIGAPE